MRTVSFKITDDNDKKMKKVTTNTGITQTEFINAACAGIKIVCLENSCGIADRLCKILDIMENGTDVEEIRKEVDELCQSLSLLTAEIQSFRSCQG